MIFIKERAAKICEDLAQQQTTKIAEISQWQKADGHFLSVEEVEQDGCFTPFDTKDTWGGKDYNGWFQTQITLDERHLGARIVLQVRTDLHGWDAINPQFMVFVNGELKQGLDMNHQEVRLCQQSEGNEHFQIDLHAYTSMSDLVEKDTCRLFVEMHIVHQPVRTLYFHLKTLLDSFAVLDEHDILYVKGVEVVNDTVNLLDLRQVHSVAYDQSIEAANRFIEEHFYNIDTFAHKDGVSVAAVGHTHIDIAWHWSIAQTRQKVARSFATALDLMERYPDFTFMSSQAQLYAFVKADYPKLYARIKEQVRAGRWEVEGAMWVEADCNVTSGESLIRQIIFGKTFMKEEFGVDSKILWLPDVFGYSAALPQILKKSNIDYFMTTKINWNQFNQLPYDTFYWKGLDGTKVLTHMITTPDPVQSHDRFYTTYNGMMHPSSVKGAWNRYQQKYLAEEVLMAFGHGDGGGGVTYEMLETAERLQQGYSSIPKVTMKRATTFFETLAQQVKHNKRLPTWTSELYMEGHRGTYTSMARNKRDNRRCELEYQRLEKIASITHNVAYPKQLLSDNWRKILVNQFHDILPGTSIEEVYEVTQIEYTQLLADAARLQHDHLHALAKQVSMECPSLFVFYPTSHSCAQVVTFHLDRQSSKPFYLRHRETNYPVQRIEEQTYLFVATPVSIGYQVYEIVEGELPVEETLSVTTSEIETPHFKIKLNEHGEFTSFYDKQQQRQVIPDGQLFHRLVAFEDKPMHYDNWDIDIYYEEKKWEIKDVQSIVVSEAGPLRACLQIERTFLDSTITQSIYAYAGLDRIDVCYTIDWRQSQILLKAVFPVDVNTTKATYDVQFGNVERPTYQNTSWDVARFEVCAHQWVDLSEGNYGVSLLNDSKYGHDIHEQQMRITLLKSGIHPFDKADQEVHQFSYSIYPHRGTWRDANTQAYANTLNLPANSFEVKPQQGTLPDQLSFFQLDVDTVMIDTIKQAEDGNGYIIRMYEYHNQTTHTKLTTYAKLKKVYVCDLMEAEVAEIAVADDTVELVFTAFEIKTLRVYMEYDKRIQQ